ncbi:MULTISPECIES: hypothetical protein [Cupriavidus]|uniref:Uncharacterized protein n=1 Tax=Cupriavidus basilensis TaxID=68895 RepID=A0A643FIS3_9BURK|nr:MULTISPECIES: hypothetical protein [Cupriavidus]QOT74860.1 hypothetical protein F7R26_011355 [Cupriavidus basilensis]
MTFTNLMGETRMTEKQEKAIKRAAELMDQLASDMDETFMRGRRWEGSEAQKADRDEYRTLAASLRAVFEGK